MPSGDGDIGHLFRIVADFFDVGRDLLDDLVEAFLTERRLARVHLVDGDDHLLHSERVGQQGVLAGLAVLGDASLKLTGRRGNHQHCHISLEKRPGENE